MIGYLSGDQYDRVFGTGPHYCALCKRNNDIVNECGCDPNNLTTRPASELDRLTKERDELRAMLITTYDLLAEAIEGHPQYDFKARAELNVQAAHALLVKVQPIRAGKSWEEFSKIASGK